MMLWPECLSPTKINIWQSYPKGYDLNKWSLLAGDWEKREEPPGIGWLSYKRDSENCLVHFSMGCHLLKLSFIN